MNAPNEFSLTLQCFNAAFSGDGSREDDDAAACAAEVARLLRKVAAVIAEGDLTYGSMHDSNGNTVGTWSFMD